MENVGYSDTRVINEPIMGPAGTWCQILPNNGQSPRALSGCHGVAPDYSTVLPLTYFCTSVCGVGVYK